MQIISSGRIKMAPNDEEKIISKTEEERGLRNRKKKQSNAEYTTCLHEDPDYRG